MRSIVGALLSRYLPPGCNRKARARHDLERRRLSIERLEDRLVLSTWEVVYDGVDSAADNVPNHLRWDSAIDDDWDDPGLSYWLNTPTTGFLTVDRATNPADHQKTGNIWMRDPILSHADGFTMEVRVKIMPNSTQNAFTMNYLDYSGSFGVHLSPNQIKAGELDEAGVGNTVAFDTTDDFHLYRIVKQPNSFAVSVYVDDSPTPIVTGSGNSSFAAGTPSLLYPRVLIGDNSNNALYSAHYVLDFARYRRGASAPGETPPTFPDRVLPPAPQMASANEVWTGGYEGVGIPSSSEGWIVSGGNSWTQNANGVMELDTRIAPANARIDGVAEWTNMEGITIEARIKVLPDSEEAAFNLVANDLVGDTSLVLSTDKVQLMHPGPVGRAAIAMDTTDDYHIYRLTREANGLYWNLYIDNNPVAAIENQHTSGTLLSFTRIWFGDIAFPFPENGGHVLIDYIRWHEGASAPPLLGDYNGDRSTDAADYVLWRSKVGTTSGPADGNRDGTVDDGDYVIWRDNFGEMNLVADGAVWRSTFDTTADGVVDVFDNNPNHVIVGAASGGRLEINALDDGSFTPDKAGRPLGVILNGNDSMSGQYKFSWENWNQSETHAGQIVGFLGTTAGAPQTRQILGTLIRQWRLANGDHYIGLDVGVGSAGWTGFGYLAGPSTYVADPTQDFELRIQYDGTTHFLDVQLLDSTGQFVAGQAVDLDTDVPAFAANPALTAMEYDAFALRYLGWSDYSWNFENVSSVWRIDELTYYDTPQVPATRASAANAGIVALIASPSIQTEDTFDLHTFSEVNVADTQALRLNRSTILAEALLASAVLHIGHGASDVRAATRNVGAGWGAWHNLQSQAMDLVEEPLLESLVTIDSKRRAAVEDLNDVEQSLLWSKYSGIKFDTFAVPSNEPLYDDMAAALSILA